MNEFPPTCLMIKQHQETRLLYLCKSSNKNAVDKYKGSGKYWKSHIKLYGEDKVETIWACWFFEKTGLVETALLLSSMYDVVDSNGWANLKPETGLDGGRCSDESIKKISKSAKGRIPWNKGIPRTDEVKRKLSESKKGKPGRVQSEAEKEKRRHPITQEHKDNIAAAKLGKKRTIEERKAISEGIARAKLKKIVDFYLEDDSDD